MGSKIVAFIMVSLAIIITGVVVTAAIVSSAKKAARNQPSSGAGSTRPSVTPHFGGSDLHKLSNWAPNFYVFPPNTPSGSSPTQKAPASHFEKATVANKPEELTAQMDRLGYPANKFVLYNVMTDGHCGYHSIIVSSIAFLVDKSHFVYRTLMDRNNYSELTTLQLITQDSLTKQLKEAEGVLDICRGGGVVSYNESLILVKTLRWLVLNEKINVERVHFIRNFPKTPAGDEDEQFRRNLQSSFHGNEPFGDYIKNMLSNNGDSAHWLEDATIMTLLWIFNSQYVVFVHGRPDITIFCDPEGPRHIDGVADYSMTIFAYNGANHFQPLVPMH